MKIWLDDIRPAPEGWTWCKNYWEAFRICMCFCDCAECVEKDLVLTDISFDHDLGTEETGYTLAKEIERWSIEGNWGPVKWAIHSANPVGRKNIEMAMKNAEKSWGLKRRQA